MGLAPLEASFIDITKLVEREGETGAGGDHLEATFRGEDRSKFRVRELLDLPIPASIVPQLEFVQEELGRYFMMFDGNDSSVGQSRGLYHLWDLTIEVKKETPRKTLAIKLERCRFAAVLTVHREMAILSTNEAEWGIEATRLEMARLVAHKASEVRDRIWRLGKRRRWTGRRRRGGGRIPSPWAEEDKPGPEAGGRRPKAIDLAPPRPIGRPPSPDEGPEERPPLQNRGSG